MANWRRCPNLDCRCRLASDNEIAAIRMKVSECGIEVNAFDLVPKSEAKVLLGDAANLLDSGRLRVALALKGRRKARGRWYYSLNDLAILSTYAQAARLNAPSE